MSKNLYTLQSKRVDLVEKMEKIVNQDNISDADQRSFDRMKLEVQYLDEEITREQHQDMVNKRNIGTNYSTTTGDNVVEHFRSWIDQALNSKGGQISPFKMEARANPILSTTDANAVAKNVVATTTLFSPHEALLTAMGVQMITATNGQLVLPTFPDTTAGYISEGQDSSTANLASTSLVLNPRRVSHSQKVTKEALASGNPAVVQSIVDNLYQGIWQAVSFDFFDQLEVDAASQISTLNATSLSNSEIVKMEASTGSYSLVRPSYVMNPVNKAYLKNVAVLTNGDPIWKDDKVNGYPAYGINSANVNKIVFGDFNQTVIANWGLETIVDIYTEAAKGNVIITTIGLFDEGVINKRAFCIGDVSAL